MQEGNEEPFNIRLHLAKDILTIQEQDVICVSGEPFYSSVSNPVLITESRRASQKSVTYTAARRNEGYNTKMLRTLSVSALMESPHE